MSSPVPKSPEQSDKSKKYDRQIRLWGEHGQNVLEKAKICLVNATAVGCEVLKGLVLPGIGGFTIVDGSVVTEDDLGVNFFLDATCIGHYKASACMQLLQELNPDVGGNCVDESVEYILSNRPTFFESYDIVVASNLNEKMLLQLSNCLWEANIPLIYCRSLGFLGTIRLQIKEICVIETHPDNRQLDLRLDHPFATLNKHLETTTLTNKVPWLLVLNKYYQEWTSQNVENVPKTFKEKSELRELIRKDMPSDAENYEEAIKAVNSAFGGGTLTSMLKSLFEDDACTNLNKQSSTFWIMLRALKDFVEVDNEGRLPLSGILPDMTADTESYINLQNIYRQQALQDADNIYRKCQDYLRKLELPEDIISDKDVRIFSREAAGLSVIRGTKIADEYEKTSRLHLLDSEVQDPFTIQYVALRAYERFLTECGNVPGELYVENDILRLKSVASKILLDCGAHASISDDMIHEICRYGGAELHSVSAFIGGCVAQEVIKVITKQYKSIDNTFLYNAITSETTTMKF